MAEKTHQHVPIFLFFSGFFVAFFGASPLSVSLSLDLVFVGATEGSDRFGFGLTLSEKLKLFLDGRSDSRSTLSLAFNAGVCGRPGPDEARGSNGACGGGGGGT